MDSKGGELMPHDKTNWIDRITPLSAQNFNNLEKQYDEAIEFLQPQIDRIQYDNYLRTLELYYTGHFSGPVISGFKGMTFDGFLDTNRVNIGASTASIDTVNKWANGGKPIYCVSAVNGAAGSGLNDTLDFTNLSNLITGTSANILDYVGCGTGMYGVIKCDLGAIKALRGISIDADCSQGIDTGKLKRIAVSQDGISWTILTEFTEINVGYGAGPATQTWETIKTRYVALEFFYWDTNNGTVNADIYSLQFIAENLNTLLLSSTKNLDVSTNRIDLYFSVDKVFRGVTGDVIPKISVDGGSTFITATLESQRTDPKDASYIEYKYTAIFITPGDSLVIKFEFVSPSILKVYGAYWS